MTSLDGLREKLGIAEPWVESRGTYWLNPGTLSLRDLVRAMNQANARFITITAYQLPGAEGFRLEYHWDLEGRLLGFPFTIAGNSIDSIFDLCEAVDWIEREVHEGFAIDFNGRIYEPLLLRKGDEPGVNLREAPAARAGAGTQPEKEVAS
jgi:hypothetical protein